MEDSRIHIDGLKPADVALLKAVASEAAEQAVNKILITMGMDPVGWRDAQADQLWLRKTRLRCEGGGWQATAVLIGVIVAGAAGVFWTGFKQMLGR